MFVLSRASDGHEERVGEVVQLNVLVLAALERVEDVGESEREVVLCQSALQLLAACRVSWAVEQQVVDGLSQSVGGAVAVCAYGGFWV